MYLHARHWGLQPSEFWAMTMTEWWVEYELHAPQDDKRFAGTLTQGAVDDILDWMDERARAKDGTARG